MSSPLIFIIYSPLTIPFWAASDPSSTDLIIMAFPKNLGVIPNEPSSLKVTSLTILFILYYRFYL